MNNQTDKAQDLVIKSHFIGLSWEHNFKLLGAG